MSFKHFEIAILFSCVLTSCSFGQSSYQNHSFSPTLNTHDAGHLAGEWCPVAAESNACVYMQVRRDRLGNEIFDLRYQTAYPHCTSEKSFDVYIRVLEIATNYVGNSVVLKDYCMRRPMRLNYGATITWTQASLLGIKRDARTERMSVNIWGVESATSPALSSHWGAVNPAQTYTLAVEPHPVFVDHVPMQEKFSACDFGEFTFRCGGKIYCLPWGGAPYVCCNRRPCAFPKRCVVGQCVNF
jgi:hypothetical protein